MDNVTLKLSQEMLAARMAGGSREQWIARQAVAITAAIRTELQQHLDACHAPVATPDAKPAQEEGRWYRCDCKERPCTYWLYTDAGGKVCRTDGNWRTAEDAENRSNHIRLTGSEIDTARATIRGWQQKLIEYDADGWPKVVDGHWYKVGESIGVLRFRHNGNWYIRYQDGNESIDCYGKPFGACEFSIDGIIWHPYQRRERVKPEPKPNTVLWTGVVDGKRYELAPFQDQGLCFGCVAWDERGPSALCRKLDKIGNCNNRGIFRLAADQPTAQAPERLTIGWEQGQSRVSIRNCKPDQWKDRPDVEYVRADLVKP